MTQLPNKLLPPMKIEELPKLLLDEPAMRPITMEQYDDYEEPHEVMF